MVKRTHYIIPGIYDISIIFYIFMVKIGHGFAAKPRPSLAITSQRREGARGGLDVTHAPELMRD
jgi:hypothetical protein